MLTELADIEHCIIYSCYVKKDSYFPQVLKEDIYIELLTRIAAATECEINIIFDTFNKQDFESKITVVLSALPNVLSICSQDSQKNPGLQFADNLCSTCRHHLDENDTYHFYDVVKENIKEV